MNVQRTVPQVTRLGRAAHPHLSLPATSQLTKLWSRGQRRSCRTCCCLLDQPVLSKEVKDQEGRRLMIFWGWGERERRKGQKIVERALARLLLKAAVQLHLCLSSAAKHQWTWTSGTLQKDVSKSCMCQCVWEFAHHRYQKATRQGLWCCNPLQAHGTSIPTMVQGLSLYLLWCCIYLEERLLQTAP